MDDKIPGEREASDSKETVRIKWANEPQGVNFDDLRRSSHEFDVVATSLYRTITAADFDAVKLLVNLALDLLRRAR